MSQIGVPDFTQLTVRRAVALLEQHSLHRLPTQQARADWLEEMGLPMRFDEAMYRDLVSTGAAVDFADAHDILSTQVLIGKQEHRRKELQNALAARRAPRINEARGR